jgi:hypothetical protein
MESSYATALNRLSANNTKDTPDAIFILKHVSVSD